MSEDRTISTATEEASAAWFALTLYKQSTAKGVNPEGLISTLDSVIKGALWKGKANSLEEFLHSPYPDGAGISRKLLEHALRAPFTHQLAEVEQDVEAARLRILDAITPQDNRKDNGQHLKEWERDSLGKAVNPNSGHYVQNLGYKDPPKAETRAKAVARAPKVARELHIQGLIGVQEVVKLGPKTNSKKPTAEQLEARARADGVGAKLERWVESNPIPAKDEDRPKYKRQVNAAVREWLSEAPLVTVTWKADATPETIAASICKKVPPEMLSDVIQLLTDRSKGDD